MQPRFSLRSWRRWLFLPGLLLLAVAGCPVGDDDTTGDDDVGDDDIVGDDDDSDDDDDDTTPPPDSDGDGVPDTEDCDAEDPQVHPGADEVICDGVDNDCDEATEDEPDGDGDGASICDDCDDDDAARYPGAEELCDGLDNDCDDALPPTETDSDADGYMACEECNDDEASLNPDDLDGDGFSSCDGDCDDDDGAVHPAAAEVCDGHLDNDCDGVEDPAELDEDQDGFTGCDEDCDDDDAAATPADADGDGISSCDGDCDDDDDDVFPGQAETLCNGRDDDCDASSEDSPDADADGSTVCDDCDDADPTREVLDQDGDGSSTCDGDCDDADPAVEVLDRDGDGWTTCDGDCNDDDSGLSPDDGDLDGWTSCDGDCDDTDPAVSPAAFEVCDGQDNDCDPGTDENLDADGDGQDLCDGDCDDSDPTIHALDTDGDGWDTCSGDCDDGDASMNLDDTDEDGYSTCDGDCLDDWHLAFEAQVEAIFPLIADLDDYEDSANFGWCDLEMSATGMTSTLDPTSTHLVQDVDSTTVQFDLVISVNDAGSPFLLDLDIDGFLCDLAGATCDAYVEPFAVTVEVEVAYEVIEPGGGQPRYLEATASPAVHDLETAFEEDDIVLDGCNVASVEDILGFLGLDLADLMAAGPVESVAAYLDQQLLEDLEQTMEAAYDAAISTWPGAPEACDGMDTDCDGDDDDDPIETLQIQLDNLTYTPLGYEIFEACESPVALADAPAVVSASLPGTLVDGCVATGTYLDFHYCYAPPGDFGGAALVDGRTGDLVFAGETFWSVAGDAIYPLPLQPSADLAPTAATPADGPVVVEYALHAYEPNSVGDDALDVVLHMVFVDDWLSGREYDVAVVLHPYQVGPYNPALADLIVLLVVN